MTICKGLRVSDELQSNTCTGLHVQPLSALLKRDQLSLRITDHVTNGVILVLITLLTTYHFVYGNDSSRY